MLQDIAPSASPPSPQPPVLIVLGVYLRCLRTAKGVTLESAARVADSSNSAVSRWERGESALSADALRKLLHLYGVEEPHVAYLLRSLPRRTYDRGRSTGQWRCPGDHWADVAGVEALARYIAVMRSASSILEFSLHVPAGLRTQAYERAVLDPTVCLRADEPVLGLPRWVHGVPWAEGQQRTVLLDETVLTRPVGGPQVMADQLRNLARLMSGEASKSSGLVIRILPISPVRFVHTVSWPAEVTLSCQRMVTSFGLVPSYETASRVAQAMSAGLGEALSCAYGHEETYELIMRAAGAMERRAAS